METLDDAAVLRLIAQKDGGALGELYDRHGRLAYSLAFRILGDSAGAEEVVQEAFLSVWRKAASYNQDLGSPRTWLISIVRHRAIDTLRGRRRQPPLAISTESHLLPISGSDVWERVDHNLDREAIQKALAQIPQEQREVIELAYFGGYTHREIASMKQLPLGTVKSRTRVGMEKLRHLLRRLQARA